MKAPVSTPANSLLSCCIRSVLFVSMLLILFSPLKSRAKESSTATLAFIENKGQWNNRAKYKVSLPGGAMFITDNGFVYNYISPEDDKEQRKDSSSKMVRHHAYALKYVNAKKPSSYLPQEKVNTYYNYLLGKDSLKWGREAEAYHSIRQQEVYAGVDVVVYSKENTLKYDFIIKKGHNPAQIALAFEGVKPVITPEGHLKITTSVNEVLEQAPIAYQEIMGKSVPVPCKYRFSKGLLTYDFPNGYNKEYELIIDPAVVFSTFSGGQGAVFNSCCTAYDNDGNGYVAGYTLNIGWPVTLGAFQMSGEEDVVINKYDATGANLLYATYYGGNPFPPLMLGGEERPIAMIVNDADELILMGTTASYDLPVTAGCFQPALTPGGYNSGWGLDLFVAHFNSTGSGLIGATYIGGTHDDGIISYSRKRGAGELTLDANGNIAVISHTVANDFPVTPNAIEQQPNPTMFGGQVNCIVFSLNATCSQLLYSTYFGGCGSSYGNDIIYNHAGNLVICGETACGNFPTTTGALHPSINSTDCANFNFPFCSNDGFVAIINPATGALLQSTYVGTEAVDMAQFVQVDKQDNVYVAGYTSGDYPVSQGTYAIAAGDVFIDKLSPDLSTSLLSTRWGNDRSAPGYSTNFTTNHLTEFLLDGCEDLILTSYNADQYLPVTPNAFQPVPRKFWIGILKPSFSGLKFGTYYGSPLPSSDHINNGGIQRCDPKGFIYHSANAVATFPTTSGSYAPVTLTPGMDDIAFFKLDLSEFAQSDTSLLSYDINACFLDSLRLAPVQPGMTTYEWNTGAATERIWAAESGSYFVKSIVGPGCRLLVDTFHVAITSMPQLSLNNISCEDVGQGSAKSIIAPGNKQLYSYSWSSEDSVLKETLNTSVDSISGLFPGNYSVQITTAEGCDTTILFRIKAVPGIELQVSGDTLLRKKGNVQLWATGAERYIWTPSLWLDNSSIADPIATPQENIEYVVVGYNGYGCEATDTVRIEVDFLSFMPTAFSPNGDALNDVFHLIHFGYNKLLEFTVYNRFGESVFFTADINKGWDGTYKGDKCDVGTYFYYIGVQEGGGIKTYKGDITLVR